MKHQKEWCTCDRCGAEIKKGIFIMDSLNLWDNIEDKNNIDFCDKNKISYYDLAAIKSLKTL